MSSAAAVNSLAVEPGSNGSVKVEARGTRAGSLACRDASASSSPLSRVEEDHVAALGLHLRQRVVEPALGDLLQLRIDREDHVVPGHRLAHHPAGRVVAAARAVLEQHRFARLGR